MNMTGAEKRGAGAGGNYSQEQEGRGAWAGGSAVVATHLVGSL